MSSLEKKAAPPLFSRPCRQLVVLCLTCLFWSLRHGRLGLIEVFPFLSFFYSSRSSLWSLRVFPLVIKIPHLHLHSFEVKCDERTNEQTNLRTGRNHKPCLLLVQITLYCTSMTKLENSTDDGVPAQSTERTVPRGEFSNKCEDSTDTGFNG